MLNEEDLQVGNIVRFKVGETNLRICSKVIEAVFVDRLDNGKTELYPITSLEKVD